MYHTKLEQNLFTILVTFGRGWKDKCKQGRNRYCF